MLPAVSVGTSAWKVLAVLSRYGQWRFVLFYESVPKRTLCNLGYFSSFLPFCKFSLRHAATFSCFLFVCLITGWQKNMWVPMEGRRIQVV